jgi:replication factor A1
MNDLITKLSADSGLKEEEILSKVKEKQEELSGLISEEGAVYIVAKELGVQLLKKKEKLFVGSIVPGMKNVDIVGKIVRVFPTKEFKTDKAEGKVTNIVIGDHTGSVRMSLWNDEISILEELKEGDVISVKGFSKEGYDGSPELRIGKFGALKISDEKIEVVDEEGKIERSSVKDLQEGYKREIRGSVVQVFNTNIFYPVCPQCNSSLKEANSFKCEEHGEVEADHGMVVSGIVDDSTESVRVVMFNEQAEVILGMKKNEAKRTFDMKKDIKHVLDNVELGKDFIFTGKVRRNTFFDRLEFVVNSVRGFDVKEEIKEMIPNE